ncbi:MAG: septum formation initiator family protein [Thermodesulfobacteriota bacterium]
MKKSRGKQPGLRFKAVYIFGAVILAITLFTVFGDKGLIDVYRIKKDRNNILRYNSELEKENAGLERRIALLKKDRRYIEDIAKKELGMIRKDEVVYRFEALD